MEAIKTDNKKNMIPFIAPKEIPPAMWWKTAGLLVLSAAVSYGLITYGQLYTLTNIEIIEATHYIFLMMVVIVLIPFIKWQIEINRKEREKDLQIFYNKIFLDAIEDLSATKKHNGKLKPDLETRLAAIYMLKKIAHESGNHQRSIINLFCAYVRQHYPIKPKKLKENLAGDKPVHLRVDIEEILKAINIFKPEAGWGKNPPDLSNIDLSNTILQGLQFRGFNLSYTHFENADLIGVSFKDANLVAVSFTKTELTYTNLAGANICQTYFDKTANLRQEQIDSTFGNLTTKIAENIKRPDHWYPGKLDRKSMVKEWQQWQQSKNNEGNKKPIRLSISREKLWGLAVLAALGLYLFFMPKTTMSDFNIALSIDNVRLINMIIPILGALFLLRFMISHIKISHSYEIRRQLSINNQQFYGVARRLSATQEAEGKPTPNIEIRISAIYTLKQIAQTNHSHRLSVIDLLCAYIRKQCVYRRTQFRNENAQRPLRADIEAALKTIDACRPIDGWQENMPNLRGIDLKNINLRNFNLRKLDLSQSYFEGANLREVDLEKTNLSGAHLERADLFKARFGETNLLQTDFNEANICQASLSQANELTQKQVDSAFGDQSTKLPTRIRMPKLWPKESLSYEKRMEEWEWWRFNPKR